MSDLGSFLPVPVAPAKETREMKLKWLQTAKQERISKIAHLRQAIEDLMKGRVPDLERQILQSEQELRNLEISEQRELRSIETTAQGA